MDGLHWTLAEEGDPDDLAAISAGLRAFNVAAGGTDAVRPLCCTVKLASGELIGGAVGRTWGGCAELLTLWVAEAHRKDGLGSGLLGRVEAEAVRRGCITLNLDTLSFQAPDFYARHGFRTILTIEGFPNGIRRHFMQKAIGPAAG